VSDQGLFQARTKDHSKNAPREGHSRDCFCDVRCGHLANHGQVEAKRAKGPKERRAVLCDIAEVILELDKLLSIEIDGA
jgi:hypothetical protein